MSLSSPKCFKKLTNTADSLPVALINAKPRRTQRIAKRNFLRDPLRPSYLRVHRFARYRFTAYSMRISSRKCLKSRTDTADSLPVALINAKPQRARRDAKKRSLRDPSRPSYLRLHRSARYRLTAYSMRISSRKCLKSRMDIAVNDLGILDFQERRSSSRMVLRTTVSRTSDWMDCFSASLMSV